MYCQELAYVKVTDMHIALHAVCLLFTGRCLYQHPSTPCRRRVLSNVCAGNGQSLP